MKEQPLILVVDDEPAILGVVQQILEPFGYGVDTAANGKEAVAALQLHPYDLVLTDMMMPEMGGMELMQYLKLHHPETLIIVFTGYASFQDAVDAVKLGAFDYLPKPLQPEILQHAVARALEYRRLLQSQRDLEVIFQGAEALGWQALELMADTSEAAILRDLREQAARQPELPEVGTGFLTAARDLLKVATGSIFLHDAARGQFSRLAALGPALAAAGGAILTPSEVMDRVLTQRRPFLVPDLSRESQVPKFSRARGYQTGSIMVIPLTGYRFWGVINLSDRQDGQPFGARDFFLGWLLGRLLVEVLEAREAPPDHPALPSLMPWVDQEIPVGLALLNRHLNVVWCNPAMERMASPPGESLTGQELFSRLGLGSRERQELGQAFRQMLGSQEPPGVFSVQAPSPEAPSRYLALKMVPLPADPRGPMGLVLAEDVSELEQLKPRQQLYEQLAVMGKLTLCVVHELNNPLDGIRRYLSLALLKKESPDEVARYLAEAQKGLQKMSASIKSLLFSANPLKAPPRARDPLYNLLQDAVQIMMLQAGEQKVAVSFQPPPEFKDLQVGADLYYVFVNLIKNALQAMPQGGTLKIDGRIEPGQLVVTVADSGPGLAVPEVEQMFQPFYSTKGNNGLGLGLPICQKILERYDGRLEVESHPGEGTQMRVVLPYPGREN